MAQVQVGFSPVLGDVNLAVLEGTHGPGVDIYVRVHLLGGHLEASGFQKPSERSRSDAFAEAGDNTSGNKNIFSHAIPPYKKTATEKRIRDPLFTAFVRVSCFSLFRIETKICEYFKPI